MWIGSVDGSWATPAEWQTLLPGDPARCDFTPMCAWDAPVRSAQRISNHHLHHGTGEQITRLKLLPSIRPTLSQRSCTVPSMVLPWEATPRAWRHKPTIGNAPNSKRNIRTQELYLKADYAPARQLEWPSNPWQAPQSAAAAAPAQVM